MARKVKISRERGLRWDPKIRYREDRGKWVVDLGTKFSPRKLYFSTEAEAVAEASRKKEEFRARLEGQKKAAREKVAFNWFNLDPGQQSDLSTAFAMVKGDTARVLRALTFHSKHGVLADSSRKVSDVCSEYMAGKISSGKRQRTIADSKFKLKPFLEAFGGRSVAEITTVDVEGWLGKQGYSGTTRNSYRRAVFGLFAHAVKRRYIEYNPVAAIETVSVDQGLPAIHTVAEIKALLKAASNFVPEREVVVARDANRKITKTEVRAETDPAKIHHARSLILPYLAIGYFAGLRPENELANLDWKDIDFCEKHIRVDPATAKKRRQRYVVMSDNLAKWLAPYVQKEGKIGFSKAVFRAVRAKAKIEWEKDVMRHSYGSYLLALNEDAPKTALQMGHTRVDVLFNNYRNLVKKSAAEEYWKIVPDV